MQCFRIKKSCQAIHSQITVSAQYAETVKNIHKNAGEANHTSPALATAF